MAAKWKAPKSLLDGAREAMEFLEMGDDPDSRRVASKIRRGLRSVEGA